jgi:hypothetical protein
MKETVCVLGFLRDCRLGTMKPFYGRKLFWKSMEMQSCMEQGRDAIASAH